MTLLRAYDNFGLDMSFLYDPDNILDIKKKEVQEAWLDNASLQEIADTKNTSKQAIANPLAKIGKKYIALYGEIAVPTLEKILAK